MCYHLFQVPFKVAFLLLGTCVIIWLMLKKKWREFYSGSNHPILSLIVNGSTELRSLEVALVLEGETEEEHAFQYFQGESDDTVWPGDWMF